MRNAINEKINPETGEKSPAPMSETELKELTDNFDKNLILKTTDTAKNIILKLEEFNSVIELSAKNRTVYTL